MWLARLGPMWDGSRFTTAKDRQNGSLKPSAALGFVQLHKGEQTGPPDRRIAVWSAIPAPRGPQKGRWGGGISGGAAALQSSQAIPAPRGSRIGRWGGGISGERPSMRAAAKQAIPDPRGPQTGGGVGLQLNPPRGPASGKWGGMISRGVAAPQL
jgi:hypothetical protein